MKMSPDKRYYVIYDEYLISICTFFDDVCDAVTRGSFIYGYTDDEETAHQMMNECFIRIGKE